MQDDGHRNSSLQRRGRARISWPEGGGDCYVSAKWGQLAVHRCMIELSGDSSSARMEPGDRRTAGFSTRLMSALGQSRRIDTAPAVAACPLRPESDRRRSKCDPSLRAANHPQNVGTIGNRAFCDGHHVTRHALVYIPPTSCPARSAPCLTNGCRVQHRIGRERCQRITRRERSA
jgi:hypothetical protein